MQCHLSVKHYSCLRRWLSTVPVNWQKKAHNVVTQNYHNECDERSTCGNVLLRNAFPPRQLKPHLSSWMGAIFVSDRSDATCMLPLDAHAICEMLFGGGWFQEQSRVHESLWLCWAHMQLFLFNTCVTPGTAQLKSNTLQESITRCVYWQRTELKWPTEKGARGFIWRAKQQNDGNYDHRGCTASKCEHPLDAMTGSRCENCCQFSFTDIPKKKQKKTHTRTGVNPSEGNQAVHYQKWWNVDGKMGATLKMACLSILSFKFWEDNC